MVRKSLLVLFGKSPSAICNQHFDIAYQSIYFVIIGSDRLRFEFRRQQELNPESLAIRKKLCYGIKKEWNILYLAVGTKRIFSVVFISKAGSKRQILRPD